MFLVQGAKGIRDENVIRLPFADGKTALIAGADVGVAAAVVLANPEPHIGKVYELTGARSQTMAQYADEFSRALGRTIQYVDVPPHIWEAKLHEAQLPAHLIAHLVTMGQLHRDNRYDRMTDSFQQLVGRPPGCSRRIRTPPRAHVHARRILPRTYRRRGSRVTVAKPCPLRTWRSLPARWRAMSASSRRRPGRSRNTALHKRVEAGAPRSARAFYRERWRPSDM